MPRISVIIPSYNHAKYIRESIQSVLDQTFQDFEIIITDDGSSDNTVDEIKKFNDRRIKLFVFDQNKGACIASNNCIENSSGEFICMLSSDDIFFPEKLQKQIDFIDSHPEIAAVFGYAKIINEEGGDFVNKNHPYVNIFHQKNRSRQEWLSYFFYKGNCLCHPSVLIRKKCYDEIGMLDERLAQIPDFDFWIRLCMNYEIFIMPENLIKFRVRDGELNASGQRPETIRRGQIEYRHVLENYLKINSIDDFLKVFSEDNEFEIKQSDIHLIPFYVSQIALKRNLMLSKEFAIDTLYDLLGNKEVANELNERFGFNFKSFIRITGENDVYSVIVANEQKKQIKAILKDSIFWCYTKKLLKKTNIYKFIFKVLG